MTCNLGIGILDHGARQPYPLHLLARRQRFARIVSFHSVIPVVGESRGGLYFRAVFMGFTKLDEGIIFSSIMGEDDSVFRVWIVLLATCKSDSISPVSEIFLSKITNKPIDEINRCIAILESPDVNSRSKDSEGKRIERISGGFKILNYERYREQSSTDFHRERMRKYRAKKNKSSATVALLSASASSSSSSSGIKEGECEGKQKEKGQKPLWRTSFDEYQRIENEAYNTITNDQAWIADRQQYHPRLDIKKSIQKAHSDFWGTVAGWKHKKKTKSKEIDWCATYQNALTLRSNQVWIPREQDQKPNQNKIWTPK